MCADCDCDCISKEVNACSGTCCQNVTKVVGVVMVGGGGTAFTEPAALTAEWELKLDAPLKTPYDGVWCDDFASLQSLMALCSDEKCICKPVWQDNVCVSYTNNVC